MIPRARRITLGCIKQDIDIERAARLFSQLNIELFSVLINLIYRVMTSKKRTADVTSYPMTREFSVNVGESDNKRNAGQVNFFRELLLNSTEKKATETANNKD
jgi:hypothetical protein